jgi:hypothetical protein
MSSRASSVFGSLVLATLMIAAPAAHAVCRSPKNICRNGKMVVLAGAEACARDLVGKSNGTSGPVGAQKSSISKLLERNWNSEKSTATGTHINEPPSDGSPAVADNLEWRLAASRCQKVTLKPFLNVPRGEPQFHRPHR